MIPFHRTAQIRLLIATGLLSGSMHALTAQDHAETNTTYDLEAYVVTANHMEVPLNTTGASITTITEEEIKASNQKNVLTLLEKVPGLNIRQTGLSGQRARISIRGMEAYQSIVIIDGIKVTDTNDGDSFNLAHLPVDNIERIEVLRGPQSVLYGSEATGGVINIITKRGQEGFRGEIDIMAGAYQTREGTLSIHGAQDKWDYSASISRHESKSNAADNDPEKDPYKRLNINANVGYDATDLIDARFTTSITEVNSSSDSAASPEIIADNKYKNYFTGLQIKHDSEYQWWDNQLNLSYTEQESIWHGRTTQSNYEGYTYRADWLNTFQLNENHTTLLGFEFNLDEGKQEASWLASDINEIFQTKSVYAQHRYTYNDQLFIDAGGRYVQADNFANHFVWKVSGSYLIAPTQTRLKASYGTSFNAPNTFYFANAQNRSTLKPERAKGFDVGVEQTLLDKKLTASLSLFNNEIQQQFAWSGGKVINRDEVRTQGYEAFIRYMPRGDLSLQANYTWLDTLDRRLGKDIDYAPHHNFHAQANWLTLAKKLNLNVSVDYVGGQFNSANERNYSSAYMIWNLAATYEVNEYFSLYLRIDNVFDSNYATHKDWAGRPYATTQGMSTYGGIRYRY